MDMSIELFMYSTLLIPHAQQLYILASVFLSLPVSLFFMEYIQNDYSVSFRLVNMNFQFSCKWSGRSYPKKGLVYQSLTCSQPRISIFLWMGWAAEGMQGSSKYAIDSYLMIHILEIALMNEGQCQYSWDPLECFLRQTSITTMNVADGFAFCILPFRYWSCLFYACVSVKCSG